ncbi:MAG: hypothetical protein MJY62_04420 [Bacteroidales bacterium]|nr:hypothetical protein [Bacteroidales bacterium]
MKRILKFICAAALAMAAAVSCKDSGNKKTDPAPKDDPEASVWKLSTAVPGMVTVKSSGQVLQMDVFETDEYNRLTAMTRSDIKMNADLLDFKYTFSGKSTAVIAGTMYGSKTAYSITATCNDDDTAVTYQGSWASPELMTTTYEDGLAVSSGYNYSFEDATFYKSDEEYYEKYTSDGKGNIASAAIGTRILSKVTGQTGPKATTEVRSEKEVVYKYTYSDKDDLQNFNAYLMNCNFPVWFAKGLPGCKKLISGMTVSRGEFPLREKFTVEYTRFDGEGRLLEAVRTDYVGEKEVCKRTYSLTY